MNFTVKAKKGIDMVVPDAISRLPAAQAHLLQHSRASANEVKSAAPEASSDPAAQRKSFRKNPPSSAKQNQEEEESNEAFVENLPTREEFLQAQREDYQCQCVLRRLRGLEESGVDITEFLEESMKTGGEFHLQQPEGLLVYSSPKYEGVRIVVPPKLRVKIFLHFHLYAIMQVLRNATQS